jgi:hypothetical protein
MGSCLEEDMTKPRPHDSTKTRVTPVFDALFAQDPTGGKWLASLLALPQHGRALGPELVAELDEIEDARWDSERRPKRREKRLAAPVSLLSWLVRHLGEVRRDQIEGDGDTAKRRWRLQRGNPATVAKALVRLRSDPEPRGWWVLEGRSAPDVWLATPRAVVVIEGKRTENGPTRNTTFLPCRHQMLRHMDAAYEIAGNRALLGFFIVEGDADGNVPQAWRDAAEETLSDQVIEGSLPHRPQDERNAVAAGFLGVTTWQRVCERCGVDAKKTLIDRV